ncbi:hypothetical protein FTX61_20870 [Nitriliruptoraceae bacterium ZYF776]|nr:hypothetical protein [Profundirhabdus halotolerans]
MHRARRLPLAVGVVGVVAAAGLTAVAVGAADTDTPTVDAIELDHRTDVPVTSVPARPDATSERSLVPPDAGLASVSTGSPAEAASNGSLASPASTTTAGSVDSA